MSLSFLLFNIFFIIFFIIENFSLNTSICEQIMSKFQASNTHTGFPRSGFVVIFYIITDNDLSGTLSKQINNINFFKCINNKRKESSILEVPSQTNV